ncbi:glycosyltransferase family 4 protein [Rhizobium sp. BE258]|jgi:glycosyltransferase involved in cell wall biosynthesis|uniref:glycosyltransferase family 4 protein n=1 Tax=Rhizobium sp. BE258 TaxID=2817722 RepID=UPI00285C9159|nr:glycosyltransferase family 4 protein [Rhizobium sp. BE258]MDR7142225.1 glycosyltransferase involved in cell wall biosynthesis [Rhizobium sp. BE258]
MTRRILLLTYYFPPDLSAGSFRATSLVKALLEESGGDLEIEVITTMPNRYNSVVSERAAQREVNGETTITRIALPPPGSGRLSQVKRFMGFARAAARLAKAQKYDLVVATSSRLMTAVLGTYIARKSRSPLYLDIRDIFVETMLTLSKGKISGQLLRVFGLLERWAVRSADGVNVVSGGFVPYFQERYGQDIRLDVFTNGVDESFLADFAPLKAKTDPVLDIVYAGNIGDGQGLDLIIPELAMRTVGKARFRVVGDGGRIDALKSALQAKGVSNVILLPPVARAEVIDIYRDADILFLHLNDIAAFERVIPSKLFEYAATGKPILAGVSGFSAKFIAEEIGNAALFNPCDVEGGLKALEQLQPGTTNRQAFLDKYDRRAIMSRMAKRLLEVSARGRS